MARLTCPAFSDADEIVDDMVANYKVDRKRFPWFRLAALYGSLEETLRLAALYFIERVLHDSKEDLV
jgi:hypothetical protein